MLDARVKKLVQNANETRRWMRFHGKPPKPVVADIRPRNPAILNLEGWYETEVVVPEKYQSLYKQYKESGSNLKVTRWALRNGLLDDEGASALGKNLDTTKFQLSCRHNDLVRLAETNHYESCMINANNGQQQLQYLADPDMAVLFVRDAAGKYSWRCLVRLVMDQYEPFRFLKYEYDHRGYAVVLYRVYGNGPSEAIFQELDKKVTVFQAKDLRHYHHSDPSKTEMKVSPTVHNNKFLSRTLWTDAEGVGWDNMRRIKIKVLKRGPVMHYVPQEVLYNARPAPFGHFNHFVPHGGQPHMQE